MFGGYGALPLASQTRAPLVAPFSLRGINVNHLSCASSAPFGFSYKLFVMYFDPIQTSSWADQTQKKKKVHDPK